MFICVCVRARSKRPSAYKVYLGTYKERGYEASKQEKNLVKLIVEPGGADIALLKLDRWVHLPACMPACSQQASPIC